MIVCPNCGWRLPPCWRAHRYFLYALYCRLDEFEQFYPTNLVKHLKKKLDIQYGPYTLHLTKPRKPDTPRYVLMILTELKVFLYNRKLIEKHKAQAPQGQLELQKFLGKKTT